LRVTREPPDALADVAVVLRDIGGDSTFIVDACEERGLNIVNAGVSGASSTRGSLKLGEGVLWGVAVR
jgi:hypothetical protein